MVSPNNEEAEIEAVPISAAVSPKSISYPADPKMHLVTDDELEMLANIEKPYQAAAALVFVGVAIPSLPQALPAISAIWKGEPVTSGALWLAILIGSLALAFAFGLNAMKGRTASAKLLTQIRSRPTMPAR